MLARPLILISSPAESAEEDCACPDDGNCSSYSFPAPTTLWQRTAALYRAPLPNAHEIVFDPLGVSQIAVLNESAQQILDRFHSPNSIHRVQSTTELAPEMTQETVEQLSALGFIQPAGAIRVIPHTQPQTLTAWLHVTNACNLRCTYCYIHKTDAAMDQETGLLAIQAIFRSAAQHGFQTVKLKYAGGEATLNFPLVRILHTYAQELAVMHGLNLEAVVLSNGVSLSREMLAFLRAHSISLMLSLDGNEESHNTQRVFANGKGSFFHVQRGIQRALAAGVTPHLSITITTASATSIRDVVRAALEYDLPFHLNFYREHECGVSAQSLQAEQDHLIDGMKAAFAEIESKLPRRRLIDGLVDHASFRAPHEYACGAGHNYIVIDEHGRVARCQMEIERTVGDVWAQDPLGLVRGTHDGFQNTSVHEKVGCRDCAWRQWCAGGCSLLTFRATGRSDVQSPYCHVYKTLYPDVLRLEGLRLLKYA